MSSKAITAFGPATVANVGCGFDILGFAISGIGDRVTASLRDEAGIVLKCRNAESLGIPLDPLRNTAAVPIAAMLKDLGFGDGIELTLEKLMPVGSGLGSSAASAAAALVAVNELLGKPCSRSELVRYAVEAERIACGTAHADNVAPALLGGFVLVRSSNPLDLIELPVPGELRCVVAHPSINLATRDSREILRKTITLALAVQQWGNTAALVAALYKNDLDLLARSLEDVVIEPERSQILPGYKNAKSAALAAGALGCSISGSGPSLFALCRSDSEAAAIAEALRSEYEKIGISCTTGCSAINTKGAEVMGDQ